MRFAPASRCPDRAFAASHWATACRHTSAMAWRSAFRRANAAAAILAGRPFPRYRFRTREPLRTLT